VVVDRRGTPLAVRLSGANRHDSVPFAARLDAVPPIKAAFGPAANAPRRAARRQGLRHPALPTGIAGSPHPHPDRPQRPRLRRHAGQASVGD
jgi:hypothetical protein